MEIIIRGKEEDLKKLKGKDVCELGKNLESEGWPSEFSNEGERDRVKFLRRKLGRPIRKSDLKLCGGDSWERMHTMDDNSWKMKKQREEYIENKEFNLSKRIKTVDYGRVCKIKSMIMLEDIKEFMKRITEVINKIHAVVPIFFSQSSSI